MRHRSKPVVPDERARNDISRQDPAISRGRKHGGGRRYRPGAHSRAPVARAVRPRPPIESRTVAPVPLVLGPTPAAAHAGRGRSRTGRRAGSTRPSTSSTFVVNYDAGFNANPAAKAAFQFAVNQWSNLVTSSVPIVINASFSRARVRASSAAPVPTTRTATSPKHRNPTPGIRSRWRTRSTGVTSIPTGPDIDAQFSSSFPAFYFGTDGNTAGKVDFVSVVLHELGHGLGLPRHHGREREAPARAASLREPVHLRPVHHEQRNIAAVVPRRLRRARERAPRDRPCGSPDRKQRPPNGGTAPRLYAPNPWQGGSSYSHLDDATFPAGNINSLMTPSIGANEVIHSPGPITLGIFADSGWVVGNLPTISVGGASVVEGKAGTRNLRFNVALSEPTTHTVTAHYATGNSTATARLDYTATSGTVTIAAGATTGSINVGVRGDNTVEPTEKFALVAQRAGRRELGPQVGVRLDPQRRPADRGPDLGRERRRSKRARRQPHAPGHRHALVHQHRTPSASAGPRATGPPPRDPTTPRASGTVNIASGATRGTISITVSPDANTEGNESIKVTLSSPVGAVIRRSLGTATINNDD